MKQFKKYLANVSEDYYRSFPAISYSKIASFEKEGPQALLPTEHIATKAMEFGQLVDTLLTDSVNFDKKIIIEPNVNITEVLKTLLKEVYHDAKTYGLEEYTLIALPKTLILDVCNDYKFRPKSSDEERTSYIYTEGKEYYEFLQLVGKKHVITQAQLQQANELIVRIKQNKYIPSNLFKKSKGVEVLSQAKIIFNGLKSMYDWLIIDHNTQTIQPIDLKTMSIPSREFLNSFFKFKYYRQAEVYTYVLREFINVIPAFKSYTILPFTFLIVSQVDTAIRQFEFEPCYENNQLVVLNARYPSMHLLIDEIKWHQKNEEYVYTREEVENNGKIILSKPLSNKPNNTNTFLDDENI